MSASEVTFRRGRYSEASAVMPSEERTHQISRLRLKLRMVSSRSVGSESQFGSRTGGVRHRSGGNGDVAPG